MSQRHILLVSPVFQGYYRGIAAALEELGYRVTTHVYDRPASFAGRLKNKALHELPEWLRPEGFAQRVTQEALAIYREVRPDAVITVKGDQLGDDWWFTLEADKTPRAVWMYDELRRMRFSDEQWAHMGPVCTYSSEDVATLRERGIDATHVPLGFDTHQQIVPSERVDALTFIGARYPNRERLLQEIHGMGCPVRAYGRQWSRHPIDIARTRAFADPGVPAGRDVERGAAYGVMAASLATLNIHGDQDGFTMRTFEACGVGAVQIVDRPEVSAYFEPGKEILVATDAAEMAEAAERVRADAKLAQSIRAAGRRRALAEHTLTHRLGSVVARIASI
ncbi:CgeB family protein [Dermabacteraceae bacterium P13264]